MRQLITLWCDNVATSSIAVAIGRTKSSLYAKRRRLGLESRKRGDLRERSPEECAATPMSWMPKPLRDIVTAPFRAIAALLPKKSSPREKKWTPELSLRCSHLAFAGVSNASIAARLTAETGIGFSSKAVADQLSRIQAFRDRQKQPIRVLTEDEIKERAESHIDLWGSRAHVRWLAPPFLVRAASRRITQHLPGIPGKDEIRRQASGP